MTPELTNCVLEGLLLLHEELSQDPESPWYVGTPDQTQVLHDELWILAGELYPRSSAALVDDLFGTVALAFHGASPGQVWPAWKLS